MEDIKERKNLAWQGLFYSIQRIDLLIISISGAGIYLTLEMMKYLTGKHIEISLFIKFAGVFFVFAIILNFVSQIFGKKSNEFDYLMCLAKIEIEENLDDANKSDIKKYDDLAQKYSNITEYINYFSIVFMFGGLLSLMYYFTFIF